MVLKTYVEYLLPGILFPEEETKEVRGKQWAFPALKLSIKRHSPR